MSLKTHVATLATTSQSSRHRFLRLFALATAVTIIMSVWMVAKADPPRTTFYSGTYYPVPNYYYYVPPQPGYSYPMGPAGGPPTGPVVPPYLTTLPSSGYYAPYNPYPYYGSPYPYPVWVPQNSVYYSGPAGGGGTIYSHSTTTNHGGGISYGRRGLNIDLGNTTKRSESTTTVTTHR